MAARGVLFLHRTKLLKPRTRSQGQLSVKEKHFAILRRHMIEVIGIHVDLAGDELGKPALDERVLTAMGRVPRHALVPSPLATHG